MLNIMILTSNNKLIGFFGGLCLLCLGTFAYAQESLVISVTPPLIQNSVDPGDFWQSQIKVINNNPYEITVYADVVHFLPRGEQGQGTFAPVVPDPDGGTALPEWINITREAITIPREQSQLVPFTIDVPEDAPPGGHYAAVLIGTRANDEAGDMMVQTSQLVTTLFFVQIEGDINESANIREFRTESRLVESPTADFILRLENKGNVHVQPQGNINIYNMWGKERGVIPLNHKSQFGNVLPNTIRKFTFTWEGEPSFSDIGRYTALATVGYGNKGKRFVSAETHFWVIPIKATLITLAVVLGSFWLVVFAIKRYVRRMLLMAGVQPVKSERSFRTQSEQMVSTTDAEEEEFTPNVTEKTDWFAPLKYAYVELQTRLKEQSAIKEKGEAVVRFLWEYKIFVGGFAALCLILLIVIQYIITTQADERSYEVAITEADSVLTIDSEEITKARIEAQSEEPIITTGFAEASSTQQFTIAVVNASSETGAAAQTAILLEENKYEISILRTEVGERRDRTVVVYNPAFTEAALAISKTLDNALLSAVETGTEEADIIVFVGRDRI